MPTKPRAARVPHFRIQYKGKLDNELIRLYLAGEDRAFSELTDRYRHRLIKFVYQMIGDLERSEDLIQETYLRVFRHLKKFDQGRKFSTWVYTIAQNLAKNELRNRSRDPQVPIGYLVGYLDDATFEIEFEDNRSPLPDQQYEMNLLQDSVRETMNELRGIHREVFFLREIEGRPYNEIVDLLKINLGTLKSRLNRARIDFAERIKQKLK